MEKTQCLAAIYYLDRLQELSSTRITQETLKGVLLRGYQIASHASKWPGADREHQSIGVHLRKTMRQFPMLNTQPTDGFDDVVLGSIVVRDEDGAEIFDEVSHLMRISISSPENSLRQGFTCKYKMYEILKNI